MAITNLQQARQMYQTGQRVAKTLDGSRPGYRGPGEYQGGTKSSSKSSKSTSPSPRGPQELGTSTRTVNRITAPPPTTRIGGKTYDVTPTTRDERDRATLKQQILNQTTLGGNRIDKYGNTKKSPFRQNSGLAGLLMGGLGMLTGIPGLSFLTGGFNRFKGGLDTLNNNIGDFRERTTGYRTQAEYEAARNQRRLQNRLDKLYSRKNLGKDYSQKNIDMLEAMGFSPTTPQNQDNARGSNLNNISSLIAAADQGEFEVPGNNLSIVNNSFMPQGISSTNPVGGVDQYAKEMEALESRISPPLPEYNLPALSYDIPINEMGGTLQQYYTQNPPDKDYLTKEGNMRIYNDGINFNTQPREGIISQVPTDDEIAIMRGYQ